MKKKSPPHIKPEQVKAEITNIIRHIGLLFDKLHRDGIHLNQLSGSFETSQGIKYDLEVLITVKK